MAQPSLAVTILVVLIATVVVQFVYSLRARTALKAQQASLRSLTESLPIGLAVRSMTTKRRGRYVVWNARNVSLFEVTAERALGNTVRDVMAPNLASEVEAPDDEMMATPGLQQRVHPRVVPGRGRRWIEAKRTPILAPDGRVLYIVSTQRDVTEERAHMDELRLASKVFETTMDAIMVTDQDDRVIMVNAAFTTMTGYTRADVLGKVAGESTFQPAVMGEWLGRWSCCSATDTLRGKSST